MKTRVLNKQGKDYSHKSASAIQEEYLSMNSTHEAILQARKRMYSATNPFEVEEARSDRRRSPRSPTSPPTRASC